MHTRTHTHTHTHAHTHARAHARTHTHTHGRYDYWGHSHAWRKLSGWENLAYLFQMQAPLNPKPHNPKP
jgi:hypothetical protein